MGFFSKLKSSVTGDWATVNVISHPAKRGEKVKIDIHVLVKSEDIEINRLYVKLRCLEAVDIPDYSARISGNVGGDTGTGVTSGRIHVRHTEEMFDMETTVVGAQSLSANSKHEFTAEFDIPGHLPPTFSGANVNYEWKAYAALDMKGNDPDSGWHEVVVS